MPSKVHTKARSTSTSREGGPDADLLRMYLHEIGEHELLTREDEQRIGGVIDAGRRAAATLSGDDGAGLSGQTRAALEADVAAGQQAEKSFVEANLRLVVSIAKR